VETIILIAVLAALGWLAFSAMLPTIAAWILAALLGAISLLIIVGNPVAGIIALKRKRSYSSLPFLGGIFGVSSLLFCPIHGARYFAWVPLILDLTIPGFLYAVFGIGAFRVGRKDRLESHSDTRDCPSCGRENSVRARVCPRCGFKGEGSQDHGTPDAG